VVSVLTGLSRFGESWEAMACEFLDSQEPWDFSAKAPKGPIAKIVTVEIGGMFVTLANRVLQTKLFDRSSLTEDYIAAELRPHRRKIEDLTPLGREKAVKRVNKAISDDMKVLVAFGLFANTEKKNVYRLTDLGVSCYERLANEEIAVDEDPAGDSYLPGNDGGRMGAAGGSHSQVTLHQR
jgi:hypothetical protein